MGSGMLVVWKNGDSFGVTAASAAFNSDSNTHHDCAWEFSGMPIRLKLLIVPIASLVKRSSMLPLRFHA